MTDYFISDTFSNAVKNQMCRACCKTRSPLLISCLCSGFSHYCRVEV